MTQKIVLHFTDGKVRELDPRDGPEASAPEVLYCPDALVPCPLFVTEFAVEALEAEKGAPVQRFARRHPPSRMVGGADVPYQAVHYDQVVRPRSPRPPASPPPAPPRRGRGPRS